MNAIAVVVIVALLSALTLWLTTIALLNHSLAVSVLAASGAFFGSWAVASLLSRYNHHGLSDEIRACLWICGVLFLFGALVMAIVDSTRKIE